MLLCSRLHHQSTTLCLFLLIFVSLLLNPVSSLRCFTRGVTNETEGICSIESVTAYCRIYLHYGIIQQECDNRFLTFQYSCNGKLDTSKIAFGYLYCCKSDLCNDVPTLYQLIAAHNTPPSSQVSSILSPSQSLPLMMSLLPTSTIDIVNSSSSLFSSSISPSSVQLSTSISPSSVQLSSTLSSYIGQVTSAQIRDTIIIVHPTVSSTSPISLPSYIIVLVTVLLTAIFLLILALTVVIFIYCNPRHVVGIAVPTGSDGTPTISTGSYEFSSSNQDLFDDGTTSGSGSGLPLLVQRSVAMQVTPRELVGKGRFGEVWRGTYKGDSVAIKIFHSKEETSWSHEVNIYQTCLMRHPNILRFIAADNKDIGIATQLWLITDYCDLGSLYELLSNEVLNETTVLKLSYTAACGLAHLHMEITGIEGKPAIAHRDIKSRNILVRSDYSCCIADLGLALRYDKNTDTVEEPPTKRVGTRRYLSPEILDDSMNTKNFDFFKRSDMYSFGLVLWEIARRGLCGGHAEDYQLPYFDAVTPDPPFEEVQRVVAIEKKRPSFPNRWSQSTVFDSIAQIIEQCWHHNSEARLTALRVKKNLSNIQSEHGKTKAPLPTTNQLQVSL